MCQGPTLGSHSHRDEERECDVQGDGRESQTGSWTAWEKGFQETCSREGGTHKWLGLAIGKPLRRQEVGRQGEL